MQFACDSSMAGKIGYAAEASGCAASGAIAGHQPQIQALIRQGSLYSLTLNEVETQLGGPLLSMNLDELLKTIFPGDYAQSLALEDADTASSHSTSGYGLQRQGSIKMPKEVSQKTVEEVWRGIQNVQKKSDQWCNVQQRTLGEMTLEDFLTRAGVVIDDCPGIMAGVGSSNALMSGIPDFGPLGAHWYQQYHHQIGVADPHQGHPGFFGGHVSNSAALQPLSIGGVMDPRYADGQISVSSLTIGSMSDPQIGSHTSGETSDKLMERRQKRMIKNRESAARSRARKQAYTNELENKISRLEQENERLRKLKEIDMLLSAAPPPEPIYRLRRTSSGTF